MYSNLGKYYMYQCTINNLIPIWLIVSGASFFILEVFICTLLVYLIM